MRRLYSFIVILAIGIAAGTAGSFWYSRPPETMSATAVVEPSAPAKAERKVLYYRNPMGAPDTSPVPKKDSMGMDYIPVYADEHESAGTVKVSLDKIQRTGVKTEKVEARPIVRTVRAVGRVEHDEALLTIVTVRSDGYIEELFVNKTGQHVKKGEPLFRLYSSQIQLAQSDLIVAMRTEGRRTGPEADKSLEGAMLRLRNLGVPQSRIDEVRKTNTNPRTIDWPSPATGDVIEKKVINGQRVKAGDELYRIADHSQVWIIADVAESDIGAISGRQRREGDSPRRPWRAGRRQGDLHLPGAQAGDPHRAGADRDPQPRGAAQDRRCMPTWCFSAGDGSAGDRGPRQCGDRQRHAAGGPRGQGRRPLRAARREAWRAVARVMSKSWTD